MRSGLVRRSASFVMPRTSASPACEHLGPAHRTGGSRPWAVFAARASSPEYRCEEWLDHGQEPGWVVAVAAMPGLAYLAKNAPRQPFGQLGGRRQGQRADPGPHGPVADGEEHLVQFPRPRLPGSNPWRTAPRNRCPESASSARSSWRARSFSISACRRLRDSGGCAGAAGPGQDPAR